MTFYPPPENPYGQTPGQQQPGGPPGPMPPPPPPGYGAPGYPPPPYSPYPPPQASNGMAVAALVCGLVGLLLFWFVLGPLAIIFGAIGRSRAKQGASGKGMATAGLVLGIVDIVGYLILISVLVDSGRGFFL